MLSKEKIKGIIIGLTASIFIFGISAFADSITKTLSATYDNIKIYVNGSLISPKDSEGNIIEPFIVNGTTYLPVRAIADAFGKKVEWNGETKSVYLGDKSDIQEITVSNAEELFNAIGSNRKILIKSGIYNLSDLASQKPKYNNAAYFEDVFDGYQLKIENVSNLTLEGIGDTPPQIITEPRYANILTFINSKNINIKNIVAGHTPDKGECVGGVLKFSSCSGINIDNADLYGCGIEGLTLTDIDTLTFSNSIIRDCSMNIMSIEHGNNINFINDKFNNNDGSINDYGNSSNVKYTNCSINGKLIPNS